MSKFRVVFGLLIVTFGVSLLFDQLGLNDVFGFNIGSLISTYWPLVIIAFGVSSLRKGNMNTGIVLSAIGIIFLASNVFDINVWGVIWPFAIIYFGLTMLKKPTNSFNRASTSSENELDITAIFWGSEQKVTSTSFIGGQITAIFGGAKVDLREITVASNGATLDVTSIFGGVEIMVPDTIRIEVTGDGVVGGWEKHFKSSSDTTLPVLRITGSAVFVGVEIKN